MFFLRPVIMRQRDLNFFRRLLEDRRSEILEEAERALGTLNTKAANNFGMNIGGGSIGKMVLALWVSAGGRSGCTPAP